MLSALGLEFRVVFIGLKDYSERRDPDRSSDSIINKLRAQMRGRDQGGQGGGLRPAAGARRGPGGRLRDHDRRPRRLRSRAMQKQTDNLVRQGSQTPGLM